MNTTQICESIESIVKNPVGLKTDAFKELREICRFENLSDDNKKQAKKAFFFCFLCEAVSKVHENDLQYARYYFQKAKEITDNDNDLYITIVNDFTASADDYVRAPTESIRQKLLGAYIIYKNSPSDDLLEKASEAAFIFMEVVVASDCSIYYRECVLKILQNQFFIEKFLRNRLNLIASDQRKIATLNITLFNHIYTTLNTSRFKTDLFKEIKGFIGYLLILYRAEMHRKYLKKCQELQNEKATPSLLSEFIKKINTKLHLKIPIKKTSGWLDIRKIETYKAAVKNEEAEINTLLSDNDVRHTIRTIHTMDCNSRYVSFFNSKGLILFHRTGSTSVILKFNFEKSIIVLKLVKFCFFNNSRVLSSTKQTMIDYGDIPDVIKIHESSEKYVVMDFLPGDTITEFTTSRNGLHNRRQYLSEVSIIIGTIISKLKKLHCSGNFHKDLSKDNVIISDMQQEIRFIDYGQNYAIADVSSADQYSDISISVAPEVLSCTVKNEHDFLWADLYSLGIIILELYNNRIAKDKNVLAALLDQTWKNSPALALLVELLIDERVDNRKSICDILNSNCFFLKNILPDIIFKDATLAGKQIVPFIEETATVDDFGGEDGDSKGNYTKNTVGLHYYLQSCFVAILEGEIKSIKSGKIVSDNLSVTISSEIPTTLASGGWSGIKSLTWAFISFLPELLCVVWFAFTRKRFFSRIFIKDYFKLFLSINYFCKMTVWFFGVGFFAKFFHDFINDKDLIDRLSKNWFDAQANFFSFLPFYHTTTTTTCLNSRSAAQSSSFFFLPSELINFIEGIYRSYFQVIYRYYTAEEWDIVLSALIVGVTFSMCATQYYKIIFSNISFVDFKTIKFHERTSHKYLASPFFQFITVASSELIVRLPSFAHLPPILLGLTHPRFWATCSWIGVIPVTVNSLVNTYYLKNTFKIYSDQSLFVLPISPAVKEIVDKFSYWHILLTAYIIVLLVGDFGLRGNILHDWLMYSFLVAVVNVMKMQIFNCYKEGPGVRATIYRCYAACLRAQYIKTSND